MADSYRRVIRRPDGIEDDDWFRLRESLADAVSRQESLAAESPHVLRPQGGLQDEPGGSEVYVDHEPASPMPIGTLFNPSAPMLNPAQLLRVTTAVFDALRIAHSPPEGKPSVHGGVCPGTILFAPDGTTKVADFGFAPAICSVLGVDRYINLAAGPPNGGSADSRITGLWEVLTPDEFTRDDRICAFIDPEKYGDHTLHAFESASDVISAGVVLHLMAEHEHPYLQADPEAHRMVEMSEFMAMSRYNGARREDLRESGEPGVQLWCDLIARTLARLSQNRPTASEVVTALTEHVKPEDAGDTLRRELDAAEHLVQRLEWEQARDSARRIAENAGAPTDVVQRAGALFAKAEANLLIDKADNALQGNDWASAREPIDTALAIPGLPADLARRARQAADTLERNLSAVTVLDEFEVTASRLDTTDPVATVELLETQLARLREFQTGAELLAPVRLRLEEAFKIATRLHTDAKPQADAILAADHGKAAAWLTLLETALASEDWGELEQQLGNRPDLRHWPTEAVERADSIRRTLDDHLAEQKWKDAIQSDHAAARQWLENLEQAVAAEKWADGDSLLRDKPRLTYWPEDVLVDANRLAASVRAAFKQEADLEKAREWCGQLKEAVQAEDWSAAVDLLAQRPVLEEWPADLQQEVAPFQQAAEKRVEARELERRRQEQESRQIAAWLERAEEAAKEEHWDEALTVLATQPPVGRLPEESLARAENLQSQCRSRLGEDIKKRLQARTAAIRVLARELLAKVVTEHFEGLIEEDAIDVAIDAEEFVSDQPSMDGRAVLRLRPRSAASSDEAAEVTCPFHFQVAADPKGIHDTETLTTLLRGELSELLAGRQQASISAWQASFREGLFPEARLTAKLTEPARRMPASADLLGAGDPAGTVETELVWDPAGLVWEDADAQAFVRRALRVAAQSVSNALGAHLFSRSKRLAPYASILAFDAVSSADTGSTLPAGPLELEARVLIGPGAPVDPQTLQSFAVRCERVRHVDCDVDLSPAEDKLMQVVAGAQQASQQQLEGDLQARIGDAIIKMKLSCEPRRIETPVEQLVFTLEAKGREPLHLAAAWSLESFKFSLPAGWEQSLADFVIGSARPQPAGAAGVSKPPTQPPAGSRKRRGLAIAAVVVVAAGLVGGWIIWPEHDPSPVRPPVVNDDPQPVPQPPVKKTSDATSDGKPETANTTPGEDPGPPIVENSNETTEPIASVKQPPADDVDDSQQQPPENDNAQTGEQDDSAQEQARQAMLARLTSLQERYDELQQTLESPTHDTLRSLIEKDTVGALARDMQALADELPAEEAAANEAIASRIDQLGEWQQAIQTYAAILTPQATSIDEQVILLEDAQDAFATQHVADLLAKLPAIDDLLDQADSASEAGRWRLARFRYQQASGQAEETRLTQQLSGVLSAAETQLVSDRSERLGPLLAEAAGWLTGAGPPPIAIDHLAQVAHAAEARRRLDDLDLDYPTGVTGLGAVEAAVQQKVSPWNTLNDEQINTVRGLLAWTMVALPLRTGPETPNSVVTMLFIPQPPGYQPFWLSQTEITVGQYRTLMRELPPQARDDADLSQQETNPIAYIPADETLAFCAKLSERFEDRLTIRMPYAAEWRHAMLAGRGSVAAAMPQSCLFDSDATPKLAPENMNCQSDEYDDLFMPQGHEDGFNHHAPVATYYPNRWLLYDLLGNVGEWVSESAGGRLRAMGGSFRDPWTDWAKPDARPARRDGHKAYDDVGLRIVVTPPIE